MFGAIYLLYNLIGGAISGTKGFIENEQAKNRGYQRKLEGNNDIGLYVDRKGTTRLLSTNELASIEYDYLTGDAWLCTGAPLTRKRNLSKEWRDNYFEQIKIHSINGKTVINDVCIRDHITPHDAKLLGFKWDNRYYAYGQWYKDIETGNLFVARMINGYKFYMDITNGKLVRLTDDNMKAAISGGWFDEDMINQIIIDFNSYRKMPSDSSNVIDWNVFYKNKYIEICPGNDEHKMMGQAQPKQLLY